jgi:hypothetical protein
MPWLDEEALSLVIPFASDLRLEQGTLIDPAAMESGIKKFWLYFPPGAEVVEYKVVNLASRVVRILLYREGAFSVVRISESEHQVPTELILPFVPSAPGVMRGPARFDREEVI